MTAEGISTKKNKIINEEQIIDIKYLGQCYKPTSLVYLDNKYVFIGIYIYMYIHTLLNIIIIKIISFRILGRWLSASADLWLADQQQQRAAVLRAES